MQISIFFKGVSVVRKKYKEILEGKEVKKKKKAKGFYLGNSKVLNSKIKSEESTQLVLRGIFDGKENV